MKLRKTSFGLALSKEQYAIVSFIANRDGISKAEVVRRHLVLNEQDKRDYYEYAASVRNAAESRVTRKDGIITKYTVASTVPCRTTGSTEEATMVEYSMGND